MFNKRVDIKFKTSCDPSGANKAKDTMKGVGEVANKAGEALGGANSNLGRFLSSALAGGIWGMVAEGVGFAIKKIVEWCKASEEAEKRAVKAATEAFNQRMKLMDDEGKALDRRAAAMKRMYDNELKYSKEMISAQRDMKKIRLEYERELAREAGDIEKVNALTARINEREAKKPLKLLEAEKTNKARLIKATDQQIRDEKTRLKKYSEELWTARTNFENAQRKAQVYDELDEFNESDKGKQLRDRYEKAKEALKNQKIKIKDLETSRGELVQERENLKYHIEAFHQEREMLKLKEKNNAKEKEATEEAKKSAKAAEEKKKAEEKRIADVKAAELKAAAEAAKVREQLDREAHKKRMADIRAEIAAATGKGNLLKATAADAQNEFDRAFAMYRDPARAASVIGEEEDYRNDLNRLHRDATRYGGRWRIDELSRLMAAGDSQGVSDTLANWRKSKSFSPQIEAMVRASAAERTKTTAEEELRKIQANTAGLAEKLDELLAMKG